MTATNLKDLHGTEGEAAFRFLRAPDMLSWVEGMLTIPGGKLQSLLTGI